MRILIVSAHYPPDFVSGGTLVPQRLARGLQARGHDVAVYAGWLGQDRAPLETWEENEGTGLTVRWIASRPWIVWSDNHNFDNPPVDADFAGYLSTFKPDVVHLHTLQSLGCGLVEKAADLGVPVVVTMHDFWWICARQFLVDRTFHPCCLVVDVGACPCQVDRAWLETRNSRLCRALARVDMVLTPSESAASVLLANGVSPERLEVDENGLPAASLAGGPHRERSSTGDPVRLLFAGGADEMKGASVLLAALGQLADHPGWRLTAYGIDAAGVPAGLPIDARPRFGESQLAEVLASADVLILPSVMIETFSILTREALTAGLPVIATDTMGPEEVIQHEKDGLIVPAADPDALARAIRRLLDEPGLLGRLRRGCAAVPIRPLDDQVTGVEARYQRLLAERQAARRGRLSAIPAKNAKSRSASIHRVVFVVGIDGAPLRYRAWLPAEGLELLGIRTAVRHYRDPELPEMVADADVVVVYRVPATVQVLDLIVSARQRGCLVLFDVDDLIFDPDLAAEIPAMSILPPEEAELWLEGVRRYRTTMEACDAFVGSTDELCRHAAAVTGMPVERFGNGVGILLGRASDRALHRPRPTGPLRLGYFSGTTTHDRDWALIESIVVDAMDRHRDVELWLGGYLKPSAAIDRHHRRVRRLPMVPWTELPSLLRAVDINLAPLEPGTRFNEAKSAIKWLEAALVATPTIASPTQPFREAIIPGESGLLADGADDWIESIDRLLADTDLRAAMGRQARRAALLQWSPHLQAHRYLDLLERTAGASAGEPRRSRATWLPVVLDEPPTPVALHPYVLIPAPEDHSPGPVGRWRRITRRVSRHAALARKHGVAATGRRAARVARARMGCLARSARSRVANLASRRD